MLYRFFSTITLTLLCLTFGHNALSQTVLLPNCPLEKQTAGQVVCDVRVGTKQTNYLGYLEVPPSPSKVTVRWSPSGAEEEVDLERYDPEKEKTAWLLMIDRSKSMRKETLDRIVKDFSWVIATTPGKGQIGIAAFSEKVELIGPFDAPRGTLGETLKKIQRTGDKTAINRSLLTGLDYLNGLSGATRKAIVVVTDGKEEEMTPNAAVIDRARQLGVSIYVFGYSQVAGDFRDVFAMQPLATDTNGPFRFVDMSDPNSPNSALFPEIMSGSFFSYMYSGGTITFPRRGDKFTLAATIDGKAAESLRPVELLVTGSTSTSFGTTLWKKWVAMIGDPTIATIAAIGVIVVVLGLLSLALVMLLRQPAEPALVGVPATAVGVLSASPRLSIGAASSYAGSDLPSTAATNNADTMAMPGLAGKAAASDGSIYAWLERMDGSGIRIPVKATNVRIGRHDDNDIRFDLSTVHRRHAVLHMTPKREFVITDLSGDSGNGIKVNAVKTSKSSLNEGDVVEIGEVKLKFHRASA